jgi:hypothetical protein
LAAVGAVALVCLPPPLSTCFCERGRGVGGGEGMRGSVGVAAASLVAFGFCLPTRGGVGCGGLGVPPTVFFIRAVEFVMFELFTL